MKEKSKVLLIGWNPDVVDYSKWPELTPARLLAALEADKKRLNELGYEAELLFIDDANTAFEVVSQAL